jgi:hypothetical protein
VTISLTKGLIATVDDADADSVLRYKWYAHEVCRHGRIKVYAATRARAGSEYPTNKFVYLHRHLLGVTDRLVQVDHINGNPLDNTRANLRLASPSHNSCNRALQSTNTSGYKGVYWHKPRSKWKSNIAVGRERIALGSYDCKHAAAEAYNLAATKYHGEFAFLNVIRRT